MGQGPGRPPVDEKHDLVRMTVYLLPHQLSRARELAEQQNVSVSELFRKMVDNLKGDDTDA